VVGTLVEEFFLRLPFQFLISIMLKHGSIPWWLIRIHCANVTGQLVKIFSLFLELRSMEKVRWKSRNFLFHFTRAYSILIKHLIKVPGMRPFSLTDTKMNKIFLKPWIWITAFLIKKYRVSYNLIILMTKWRFSRKLVILVIAILSKKGFPIGYFYTNVLFVINKLLACNH